MIVDDIGGLLGPINVHEMSVTKLRILIWISGNKRKDIFQKEIGRASCRERVLELV